MAIGCTSNVNGLIPFQQKMWYCVDCSRTSEPEHAVCICCKDTCHAGHNTIPVNQGEPFRGICDCGAKGVFDNSDCQINSQNPIIAFDLKHLFPGGVDQDFKNDKERLKCFCRFDWGYNDALQQVVKISGLDELIDEINFLKDQF